MLMNKKILFFITFLISFEIISYNQYNQTRGYRGSVGHTPSRGTESLATAQYSIPLSPTQINNKGHFDINIAGYYFLTENLGFYPTGYTSGNAITNNTSIYISVDNVVLDLNNKTITHKSTRAGHPSLETGGVSAITIAPHVKNITIKNGKINFVTGNGILISKGCSNISILNIKVMDCPDSGIKCVGDSDENDKIRNLTISSCTTTDCSGTMQLIEGSPPTLSGSGSAIGIELAHIINGQIIECSSNGNQVVDQDDVPATLTKTFDNQNCGVGIKISDSNIISIASCSLSNNKGPFAAGLYAVRTNNITIAESRADENHAGGLHVDNAAKNLWAAGFCLEACNYCMFKKCEACHNYTDGTEGAGFWFNGSTANGRSSFNTCDNCVGIANKGGSVIDSSPVLAPLGAGFYSSGKDSINTNQNNSFISCTAKASDSDKISASGIHLSYDNAAVIKNCFCIANGPTDGTKITQVKGYGIYLGPATGNNTQNALVQNNWLIANTWYGLKDDSDDSRSLFMENFAFRNGYLNSDYAQGSINASNINYSVQYEQSNENFPLTSGTVGGFGALNVATKGANTEIQVTADSLNPGDTGYPFIPSDD